MKTKRTPMPASRPDDAARANTTQDAIAPTDERTYEDREDAAFDPRGDSAPPPQAAPRKPR